MHAGKTSKRIEIQFQHVKDMVNEQNRMVLAEVEPTDTEREDMVSLISEIKEGLESIHRDESERFKDRYESVLRELAELGYNTSPFTLTLKSATSSPQGSSRSSSQPPKAKKQVHFDDQQPEQSRSSSFERNEVNQVRDSQYTSSQVYSQNELLIEDQDRRLMEIGNSIGRQRSMGLAINSELDSHNNMLEDIESQVDHSQSRLDRLTAGVKKFNRKSRECGTCSIIFVLVLILFIVLLI